MDLRRLIVAAAVGGTLLLAVLLTFLAHRQRRDHVDPLEIVRAYLRLTYARDFNSAYQYLSLSDRRTWDEAGYVDSQNPYRGFALTAARRLAEFIEVWPIEETQLNDRLQIKVGYRVPAPQNLAALLFDWNQEKLNALSRERQDQLLQDLEVRHKQAKLVSIQGQEIFLLVREINNWKIFLDWASGTKVHLHANLPTSSALKVQFAQKEIIAKQDDLFLVNLIIKNQSGRAMTITVGHSVDPSAVADHLELVECGLLAPVTLQPQSEQEFSMAYLLDAAARQDYREIFLNYDFKLR
jgi:hypothetical protein